MLNTPRKNWEGIFVFGYSWMMTTCKQKNKSNIFLLLFSHSIDIKTDTCTRYKRLLDSIHLNFFKIIFAQKDTRCFFEEKRYLKSSVSIVSMNKNSYFYLSWPNGIFQNLFYQQIYTNFCYRDWCTTNRLPLVVYLEFPFL